MSNRYHLRFRQVHLDFHTSGAIPGVGEHFDKEEFQKTLTEAAVDSITCFSVCHHGFAYHPTEVGTMHPNLKFDLLRAQIDAAHEAGIRVPVYISAGGNDVAAELHPEWRSVVPPGVCGWGANSVLKPGFKKLCFNTGYLDFLCSEIDEAVRRCPDADGIFLDIVFQRQCCCPKCIRDMLELGLNPECEKDRLEFDRKVMLDYYRRTTGAARKYNPSMPVFHNSGHLDQARPDLLQYFSHLELESLPTGGWGYDHFPQSAAFARKTGLEFLGMTGKFHGSWGEFGGIKHPNALRYECNAMLAAGAKCSIGDQLHPCGKLDRSTYELIGKAYREVREKEEYCRTAVNRAEIALISAEACGLPQRDCDIGAGRVLLESHFLFDVLHPSMDFSAYPLVVFPEGFHMDGDLKRRLEMFLEQGGKALFCGECIRELPFEFGAETGAVNEFSPTYILPAETVRPDFVLTPFVVYGANLKLNVTFGTSLGDVYDPYFNRALGHFCSHQHTPNRLDQSGCAAGVIAGSLAAFAHPVFSIYRKNGSVALRQFIAKTVNILLNGKPIVQSNLPSVARVTVTADSENRREIVHLLYAPVVKRGENVELIEDLIPLTDISLKVRTRHPVRAVRLVPQNVELPFTVEGDQVALSVSRVLCHQMISLEYR